MKQNPRISETEWEIMKVLWGRAPLTAEEIIQTLNTPNLTWHPKTARTLINRLVKKKALAFKKEGRVYYYSPLVTQNECVSSESESFLDRVFGGALQPMIAHFVQQRKLSPEEIKELKRLLENKE